MFTTTILSRKGTSTILGTLIFVGIIFTAFIPMMLVMKQADTLYDLRNHELKTLDEERTQEEIYVYVYPDTVDATDLTLDIQNRGNLVVNVVQVWINNVPIDLSEQISSMSSTQIILDSEYGFTPVEGTVYLVKIYTAKGNVFSSDSGSLYYDGDGWDGGLYGLNFLISYPESGWYEIEVTNCPDSPIQVHKSASNPAFAFVQVPIAGTYHVTISKNSNIIFDEDVTLNEYGSHVMWVFA